MTRRWAWLWPLLLLLAACTSVPTNVERRVSTAIGDPASSFLGRRYADELAASAADSGLRLLVAGEEAFAARLALTVAAERSLDLQYYSIADDATATLLIDQVLHAARRGVRVRILLDDLYTLGRDEQLAAIAAQPNVELRVFNPFGRRTGAAIGRLFEALGDRRLNVRMHNKVWIADNAAAVVGGRNLGDAYFAATAEGAFADLDVFVAGEVVTQISASFDAYWNSEPAVPIAAFASLAAYPSAIAPGTVRMGKSDASEAYQRRIEAREFAWLPQGTGAALVPVRARVVFDPPEKVHAAPRSGAPILEALRPAVERARRELSVVSPYFVPGERGIELLCGAAARGVHVRVLTNSLASTDVPVVHAGYSRVRPRLLACGVRLHELRPRDAGERRRIGFSSGSSLHAKAIVVDREVLLIGSMNIDPRSRVINTEIGLLVESTALATRVAELVEDATTLESAYRVSLSSPGDAASPLVWHTVEPGGATRGFASEPDARWWRRFLADWLGAWAPIDLL